MISFRVVDGVSQYQIVNEQDGKVVTDWTPITFDELGAQVKYFCYRLGATDGYLTL